MSGYKGLMRVLFDSKGNDIRDKKIYYKDGQYRIKAKCDICETSVGCLCYRSLPLLLRETANLMCPRCLVDTEVEFMGECIDEIRPDLGIGALLKEEYTEEVNDKIIQKLAQLTDEDIEDIIGDVNGIEGEPCEI